MSRRSPSFLAALALAAGLAAAAGAQEPTRLLDLEVIVTDLQANRTTTYELGEHVPLTVGDRVRIELAGSALVDGVGRRVDRLPADFEVGGGGWRLEAAPTREGGVVVRAVRPDEDDRGRGEDRLSHVDFSLRGAFEPPRFASGSVTFEIAPTEAAPAPTAASERWRLSERLARDLGHVLLVDRPAFDEAWTARVHDSGLTGARALGRQLAATALQERRLEEMPPWEVTAHLYRHLLGRRGTAAELWRSDDGFWESVELLESRGYATLVDTLVQSREFADRYELARLQSLPRPRTAIPR